MLYRIDMQHFLMHAVDYFTAVELCHFQYLVISAKITWQGRVMNGNKANILYPAPEIIATYAETSNAEIFEKEYYDMLDRKEYHDSNVSWSGSTIYKSIINPILSHNDIVLICDSSENYILDAFCHYMKDRYKIEAINLNTLFAEGHIGPIYIDRDAIEDTTVDIRRAAGKDMVRALESSRDGRLKLIGMMNKKEKIQKLKELGIRISALDKGKIDALLIDAWVDNDD